LYLDKFKLNATIRLENKTKGQIMNPMLTKCPVCGGELVVTRLSCPSCETVIEGSFQPAGGGAPGAFTPEQLKWLMPFSRLNIEQLQFILTFVRCDGRFNRMEDELKMSYPTLRNRMNDILRAMGYEPAREEPSAGTPGGPVLPTPAERKKILDDLDKGVITLAEARRRLKGIREEAAPAASD
jgi:hypothetical protein